MVVEEVVEIGQCIFQCGQCGNCLVFGFSFFGGMVDDGVDVWEDFYVVVVMVMCDC